MAGTGTIVQVIGSTFDVEFAETELPGITHAIRVEGQSPAGKVDLVGEVHQHLGGGRVRCIALGATEGMTRGMAAVATGACVQVPVGGAVLGRVMNLLGEPIDGGGPIDSDEHRPIHASAPSFEQLSPRREIPPGKSRH